MTLFEVESMFGPPEEHGSLGEEFGDSGQPTRLYSYEIDDGPWATNWRELRITVRAGKVVETRAQILGTDTRTISHRMRHLVRGWLR